MAKNTKRARKRAGSKGLTAACKSIVRKSPSRKKAVCGPKKEASKAKRCPPGKHRSSTGKTC